jgi:flagellar biosynthesis regulator FlaF
LRDVSRELEQAEAATDAVATARAVARNRRMWTLFARELTDPGNRLPGPLRADLISIAGAVDRSCSEALAGDRQSLRTLIEINRNIAAALS